MTKEFDRMNYMGLYQTDHPDTFRKVNEKVKKGPNWYGTKISEGGKLPIEERGVWGEHMAQKAKQKQQLKQKQNQKYQTTGKQSLLTSQKGGGKSGGGGGGKWGWNRLFRRGGSPWNLLKSDKNF
tara:strand:+ start:350 stop:724 length:375 start_codon:yes stop_codon:yes gene_type:complete